MTTWLGVARYHLLQRFTFLALPWLWLAFGLAVDLIIFALIPISHTMVATSHGIVVIPDAAGRDSGGMAGIVAVYFALGVTSAARSLPFALSLGVSRRAYYTGTGLLGGTLAVAYGLVLTVLQAVERATNGWGEAASIFRVPYLLDGPWYLTWLTSTVVLMLLFVYGTWHGIVYRRWNLFGTLAFTAAQVAVLLVALLLVATRHAWASVGHFFTALSATGLTGLLAALTAALVVGGYLTIRRVTA